MIFTKRIKYDKFINSRGEIREKKNKKDSCMGNASINGWECICNINRLYAISKIKIVLIFKILHAIVVFLFLI